MSEPKLIQQERAILKYFPKIIQERATAEAKAKSAFESKKSAIESEFNSRRQQLSTDIKAQKKHLESKFDSSQRIIHYNRNDNRRSAEAQFRLKKTSVENEKSTDVQRIASKIDNIKSLVPLSIVSFLASVFGLIIAVKKLSLEHDWLIAVSVFVICWIGLFILIYSAKKSSQRNLTETLVSYNQILVEEQGRFDRNLLEIENLYQQELADAKRTYQHHLSEAEKTHRAELSKAEDLHRKKLSDNQDTYQTRLNEIKRKFNLRLSNIRQVLSNLLAQIERLSPKWTNRVWHNWTTPDSIPPATQFGKLSKVFGEYSVSMPALFPFPNTKPLLVMAQSSAKAPAIAAINSLLLRLLANVPAGKLRFTFIDPIALGHNFAPFLHLADYDEALISAKVWTEKQRIEQCLVDLTEHLSTVIQKYLRNQYASIEEFNEQAGEVAEPYRILVVFDFPANFTEDAASRLVSLVQNGVRCGVYTIILNDTNQPKLHNFKIKKLEQLMMLIQWNGQRFVWDEPDFKDCVLELESPPNDELFNQLVNQIGQAAVAASKVQVPFDKVLARSNLTAWWQGSTVDGISMPLGPIGAN